MIKLYCDRCATEIPDYRDGLITANTGNFRLRIVVSVWTNGSWGQAHLCQQCVLAMVVTPVFDPGARAVTLCTHPVRRDGEVTVGESRLPAAGVVGLIRAHGVEEAELVWPQLTATELQVLERLVADLGQESNGTGSEETTGA